jgi:hypothetical protein
LAAHNVVGFGSIWRGAIARRALLTSAAAPLGWLA